MLLETSKERHLAFFYLTEAMQEGNALFLLLSCSYLRNPKRGDGKRGKHRIAVNSEMMFTLLFQNDPSGTESSLGEGGITLKIKLRNSRQASASSEHLDTTAVPRLGSEKPLGEGGPPRRRRAPQVPARLPAAPGSAGTRREAPPRAKRGAGAAALSPPWRGLHFGLRPLTPEGV